MSFHLAKDERLKTKDPKKYSWPSFPFLRTRDIDEHLDHVVEQADFLGAGGFVVHFLAGPAADDEAVFLQHLQVVAQGRGTHVHEGGQVDDAFFDMAQDPEQLDSVGVCQAAEQRGDDGEIRMVRQIL